MKFRQISKSPDDIHTTKDFDKLEQNKLSENYQPVSELAESYSFSKLSSSSRKWRSLMSFPWKKVNTNRATEKYGAFKKKFTTMYFV